MRRMYSKGQLIKLIEEHGGGGEGAVNSVNGKTGDVVLNATDIKLTTTGTSVQSNFIRVDEALDEKQDILIAGEGITIENNVISATGGSGTDAKLYEHTLVDDEAGYRIELVNNLSTEIDMTQYAAKEAILTSLSKCLYDNDELVGEIQDIYWDSKHDAFLAFISSHEIEEGSGDELYNVGIAPEDFTDNVTPIILGEAGSGSYTAGDGLQLDSDNEFSVKLRDSLSSNSGLSVNASGLAAKVPDGQGLTVTSAGIEADFDIVQHKLTAGTGISIQNNVISATGGGSGAVESVNGVTPDETGDVEIDATDIYLTTTETTIQGNIIRLDERIDDLPDTLPGYGLRKDTSNDNIAINTGDGMVITEDGELTVGLGEGLEYQNDEHDIGVDFTTVQGKLTAGTNITITGNTISATGGPAPTNMMTTDTSQSVSGFKNFTNGIQSNNITVNTNGAGFSESGGYTVFKGSTNGMVMSSLAGSTSAAITFAGPTTGASYAPRYASHKIDLGTSTKPFQTIYATNLSDGTTTKTMTQVLAGGSAPTNMVTTDTSQTITESKTFSKSIFVPEVQLGTAQYGFASITSDNSAGISLVGSNFYVDAEQIEMHGGSFGVPLRVFISNLPTTDPHNATQLWNDNGTLKISNG